MSEWTRKTYHLEGNFKWKARPGYKIFIAGMGDARFDYPEDWIIEPQETSVKFFDRQPPDDECTLEVSILHLRPDVDWSGIRVADLLLQIGPPPDQEITWRGEIVQPLRSDVQLAWNEYRYVDPVLKQEAYARTCLALGGNIQMLITFAFWVADLKRCDRAWREIVRSIQIGIGPQGLPRVGR